jgi:hypothetical protein
MIKTNDTVCAVYAIEGHIAYIYGYGTYKGPNTKTDISIGMPEIVLDSGINITGLECLWGLPESLSSYLKGKAIVFMDPIEIRKSNTEFDWKRSGLFVN